MLLLLVRLHETHTVVCVTNSRPTLGAGIAGLALAIGLQKQGVPFTIYEAEKEYSVVG
jgi:NADPH-dependent glutamate synthase beta subunit-like oxidoreductase